jgi:branched-chain amino acid aminotransferase
MSMMSPNTHAAAATPADPAPAPAQAVAASPTPVRGADTGLEVWCDGRTGPMDRFDIALNTHALHYGTGVFEGIRSYATADGAAVFRLPEHIARMQRGVAVLGAEFDTAAVAAAVPAVLRRNRQRDAYIRPLFWFGAGLGLDLGRIERHVMVATVPWTPHLGERGVRMAVSPYVRNSARAIPPLKLSGAYINSILAKREAAARGFDDALFCDAAGQVVEGTGVNVFMVKAGRVHAVAHPDALEGITRDTVMQLAGADARPVSLAELKDADEVFVTGTSAEIVAVTALDDQTWSPGPVTAELRALYFKVVRGESPDHRHWLTPV